MERNGKLSCKDAITVFYYEFLGTLLFAATIGFLWGLNSPFATLLIPVGLYAAITITGGITGGHHNPAVTLAILVGRRHFCKIHIAIFLYWIPQFIGAMAGWYVAYISIHQVIEENWGKEGLSFKPHFNSPDSVFQAQFVEFFGTYLFTYVVLCASHRITANSKDTQINMLTICLGLCAAINCAGPVSGGGVNPAIAVGFNFMSKTFYQPAQFEVTWMYIVFPMAGGFVSGVTYACFHQPHCKKIGGRELQKRIEPLGKKTFVRKKR